MNPLAVPIVEGILGVGTKLIERLFPDPEQQAKAKYELLKMQQNGDLKELETRMSAIVMEASSADPWTSRARPSFLYVVYIMILSAIPMGFLYAFSPETAANVTVGFQGWLDSIPEEMWTLFGVGYLGYAGVRTWDKREILKAKKGE
jgi:hypothetical protein